MKRNLILWLIILLALAVPTPALADGIIIPDPPPCTPCPFPPCPEPRPCPIPSPMVQLEIRYHRVAVAIDNQVAVTRVDQVFYNPNDWPVEGMYIFPIPKDAAVSNFTLWIDGEPAQGEVLKAEQARQTYYEIVNSLRDPALLEYIDQGAVQAHIFPIPPGGERRIELEYVQALAAENGLVRYIYPLGTEKFSMQPLEEVKVSVDIQSDSPIRAVYSPSHPVEIVREDAGRVKAGYEAQDVLPDTDFALYYSVGSDEAFHLLTYRDPGSEDAGEDSGGFFLLLLAPRPEIEQVKVAKDVILVLDRSGSMEGEKFEQAQEALRYVLRHLNEGDRFNIIAFSTGLESYHAELRQADEAGEALAWVDRLSAAGSTDINRALLEAASMVDEADSMPQRPAYLIFLTDGLPTEGVTDSRQILENFQESAPDNLRLFPFGVGYDVDTYLLDSLSQDHHGASSYVLPGEALDEVISTFYAKISTPVLTDLELDFGDLSVYDLYPSPLPDLFRGSQIVLVGRYRSGGTTDVTLTGRVNDEPQSFQFLDQEFPKRDTDLNALPRLWATRKIGYLLNQVRLNGPDEETIDQIVRLSIRYGIVTPYTSYLVTEPMPLGAQQHDRIVQEQLQYATAAPAEVSGEAAVQKAVGVGGMSAAEAPIQAAPEVASRVRTAGARSFVLTESSPGAESVWIDTAFDPEQMQTTRVAFLSEDYFALSQSDPGLADAFALGPRVIVIAGGKTYEVVAEGEEVPALKIPPTQVVTTNTTEPVAAAVTTEPRKPQPTSEQPESAPSSASRTCLGGLLPLVLLPAAVIALNGVRLRKRKRV